MATPNTCNHPLRTGTCRLDPDHRGRHSTVVFQCEACGKRRRGVPHAIQTVRLGDGSVDDTFGFCFLCSEVAERTWVVAVDRDGTAALFTEVDFLRGVK